MVSLALLAAGAGASASAAPTAEEVLAGCRAIAAADARLACYDRAAGRELPASDTPSAPANSAEASAPSAVPPMAAPAAPPAPPPVAVPAAPPGATPAAVAGENRDPDSRNFGLNRAQRKEPTGPDSLKAVIVGLRPAGIGHAFVTLDAGQVWYVEDSDERLSVGEQVTIKRAALGSFLMTTAERHAYRVRRTK